MGIELINLNQSNVKLASEDAIVHFGDGIFETMLVQQGNIINWHYHYQRLSQSAIRLGYPLVDANTLIHSLNQQLQLQQTQANDFQVLKLIVSRGDVERGFRCQADSPCRYLIKITAYQFNSHLYQGVNVINCQQKLGHNPLLTGLKRVSAMDYVLLRKEIDQSGAFDGLLYDIANNLVECSIGNVFLLKDNCLFTPNLKLCGVAGTLRAQLIERLTKQGQAVIIDTISRQQIDNADSIFISNAVMGIVPIQTINGAKQRCDLSAIRHSISGINHPCLNFFAD